ncbi:MAG: PspC domain-containing protein [Bacteroidales bacterium]|nr:PspC domain-containing protein [Bacteroidales bacterium]
MKETIKANISGNLYDIDLDAYEKLKNYLSSLEYKFGNNPENAKEILEDIEARIAELLNEKLLKTKKVINIDDIDEIVGLLGSADEMDDQTTDEKRTADAHCENQYQNRRRLYRDTDNSIIAGVASGIASYFQIDRVWIRLIFVLFTIFNVAFFPLFHFSGVWIILYVILWIIVPPAITTAQKLEMQGKAVNINNINNSVNTEFKKVKSGIQNYSRSNEVKKIESFFKEFFRVVGEIILIILKITGAIIGISLVLVFIVLVFSLIFGGITIAPLGIFDNLHWHGLGPWQGISLMLFCIVCIVAIPFIAIFIKFVRWIFNMPGRNQLLSVFGATVWAIAFISLIFLLVNERNNKPFRYANEVVQEIKIEETQTLYIDLDDSGFSPGRLEHYRIFNLDFYVDEENNQILNEPEILVQFTSEPFFRLAERIEYYNFEVGRVPANRHHPVEYSWNLNDTLLLLNRFYSVDEDESYRVPLVKLILFIPEGQTVQFSPKAAEIVNITNIDGLNAGYSMSNKKLKMANQKLEILK